MGLGSGSAAVLVVEDEPLVRTMAADILMDAGYRVFEACEAADALAILDGRGSVAKIVKLEHAWRRLDGRNDDGFQVAPFPG